jgi:hypothetical protein
MKKSLVISTLLFAISSLASYADSVQSVTHEIRYERYHKNGDAHSGGQIEWTLAKGSIDLSDPGQPGLIFDFDVDRDIYLNSDNDFRFHGWDTQFKLSKSYDWGKFKLIGLEYDVNDGLVNHTVNGKKISVQETSYEDYNYTTGPIWKLYGGALETFLAYDRNSLTGTGRWGFDVDFEKTWFKKTGNWGTVSLWNNTEFHYRFEDKNRFYGYAGNNLNIYSETSLLYRTPNYGPFYGSVEAYGEMFTNTKDTVNRLGTTYKLMPLVGAQWKVNHFSFNPYVSYEVFDKKTTFYKDKQNKYDRTDNRRTVTDNNELAIGLIIKWTK